MQSTSSLLSVPGPLCPGVVAPDSAMGLIELNNRTVLTFQLCTYAKLNCLFLTLKLHLR